MRIVYSPRAAATLSVLALEYGEDTGIMWLDTKPNLLECPSCHKIAPNFGHAIPGYVVCQYCKIKLGRIIKESDDTPGIIDFGDVE